MFGKVCKGAFVVGERAPAVVAEPETDFAGVIAGMAEFFDIGEVDYPAMQAIPVRVIGYPESVLFG